MIKKAYSEPEINERIVGGSGDSRDGQNEQNHQPEIGGNDLINFLPFRELRIAFACGWSCNHIAEERERTQCSDRKNRQFFIRQIHHPVDKHLAFRMDGEHAFQVNPGIGKGIGPEHHPADENHHERIDMTENFRGRFQFFFRQGSPFFEDDKKAVPETPDHEIPAGTVPDAGGQEDHEKIEKVAPFGNPVSAQRNIQIFLEPGGERNMPSAPEFSNGMGDVGIIEIFQKTEPENRAQPDRHVGISGKIIVNLEGIGQCADPGHPERVMKTVGFENPVGNCAHDVGDQHFLGQPDDESFDAVGKMPELKIPVFDLIGHVMVFHNRSGDHLGEQGDKEKQLVKILLGGNLPAVNIYEIGNRLENIEGNSDRHDHLDGINGVVQEQIQIFNQEVGVFEISENGKIGQDRQCDQEFPEGQKTFHQQRREIIDCHNEHHDEEVFRFAPGVEDHAGGQKDIVSQLFPDKIIQGDDDREEHKNKSHGRKKHD